MSHLRVATSFCLVLSFCSAAAAQQLKVEDGAGLLAPGAKLESLWEEGGFT